MANDLGPLHPPDSDPAIGERLALFRGELGMTQASFALTIGVSPRSYFHYEKGTRSLSMEALRQLRAVHGLNLMWVMYGEGMPSEGEDVVTLLAFVDELMVHLSSAQIQLGRPGVGKIVALWLKAMRKGQVVEMKDVVHWVDLLKE